MEKISIPDKLDIFEEVFFELLEFQSIRDKLITMIESRSKVEEMKLKLQLKKLELEILENKKGDFLC